MYRLQNYIHSGISALETSARPVRVNSPFVSFPALSTHSRTASRDPCGNSLRGSPTGTGWATGPVASTQPTRTEPSTLPFPSEFWRKSPGPVLPSSRLRDHYEKLFHARHQTVDYNHYKVFKGDHHHSCTKDSPYLLLNVRPRLSPLSPSPPLWSL